MDDLFSDFNKLLNDVPIDDANQAHGQSHITDIVKQDVSSARNGAINTDKAYLSIGIKDAATRSIRERMSRWIELRNDVLMRAQAEISKVTASRVDAKERELIEQVEEAKSEARETFMRNNNYADLRSEYQQTKQRYEDMRSELGGKPPVKRKLFLYLFSITIIGFVEWFINYSTFNIKYPPGVAFGATILIALSIALASHFNGALLKQRIALFAPHRTRSDKRQVILTHLIFSLLLLIALGVVTYNRYDVLQEQLVNNGGAALPGLPGQEQNVGVWGELFPFVMMNVLVWLVGVAVSYFIHDSRPDYQEAQTDYESAKKKFFHIDKGLKEEEKRIDAEFKDQIQKLKNTHNAQSKTIEKLQEYLDRVEKKEHSLVLQASAVINEMLERHQSFLVSALREQNLADVAIGPGRLSLDDYLNLELQLNEQDVRKMLIMESVA